MNKEIVETTEGMIHFKVRTFFSLVAGLVLGTNIVNTVLHNIAENAEETSRVSKELMEKIEYNEKADKRRSGHLEDRMAAKATIEHQAEEIIRLTRELEACEDD